MADATVTFSLLDVLGLPFEARRSKVWIEFNTDDGWVVDEDGNVRMDAGSAVVDDTGLVTLAGIPVPSGTTNPTDWQVKIHYDVPVTLPGSRGKTRKRDDFGWMTITADADLTDLIAEQYVPPTWLSTAISALQGMIDDAGDDFDVKLASAEDLLDAQVALSGISSTDSAVAGLVGNNALGPLTRAALRTLIAGDIANPSSTVGIALSASIAAQVPGEVADALADDPTLLDAATAVVNDALVDASVAPAEANASDEFSVRFDDGAPFIRADEGRGIFSTVQASGVTKDSTPIFVDADEGWLWYFRYSDRELAFGQRTDGSYYPASLGGQSALAGVEVVGDSVAEQWATYSVGLAAALGRAPTFRGIGGQQSPGIAARQGGVPSLATVSGNQIPASGSVGVTAITEPDGTAVSPLLGPSDGTRTLAVVIAGVAGTLSGIQSSGSVTYTFTRTAPGEALPCPAGSPMTAGYESRNKIPILIGPRNDVGSSAADAFRQPLGEIISRYDSMLSWSNRRDKALILSVLPRSDADATGRANLVTLNDALRTNFPTHFVDFAAYLRSDAAFAYTGVTKTATDATDIANGDTPTSFRSDIVHLNANGYAAANHFLSLVTAARDWSTD